MDEIKQIEGNRQSWSFSQRGFDIFKVVEGSLRWHEQEAEVNEETNFGYMFEDKNILIREGN